MSKTKKPKVPMPIQLAANRIWASIRNHVDLHANGRLDSERYTGVIAGHIQQEIDKSLAQARKDVAELRNRVTAKNNENKRLKKTIEELMSDEHGPRSTSRILADESVADEIDIRDG